MNERIYDEQRDRVSADFPDDAVDGGIAGLLTVADPVKESAAGAIEQLRREGLRIVMVTGDGRTTAQAVAARLGIEEVEAEVLPEAKGGIVERLQQEGRTVAMAGSTRRNAAPGREKRRRRRLRFIGL